MEEMRGELKGVFILFKLTSPLTHQGITGEEAVAAVAAVAAGLGGWGGTTLLTHTNMHTHNVYANYDEF